MRLFFSSDVHGSSRVWRKWIRMADAHKVDALLLCGDLCGKALVPLIEQGPNQYRAYYFGRNWDLNGEEETRGMERRLESAGIYCKRMAPSEVEQLKRNPTLVEDLIARKMEDRLQTWMGMLLEEVDTARIQTVVMPGNDDDPQVDRVIERHANDGVVYPLDRVVSLGDIEMISMAEVNPTPWETPRELPEKSLAAKIDKLTAQLRDPSCSIFNFHCPPHGTRLDLAPELDKNKKPKTVAGQIVYDHVGSKAVRKAISRHQPLLGLHGHIHESGGAERLGRTVSVNPGSEYGEGLLRGFVVDVGTDGVKDYARLEG